MFAHVVFDTYGHSPLVRHYLEKRGLLQSAGYSILVKRTEVDKLPPYPYEMLILIIRLFFLDHILLLKHRLIKIFYVNQLRPVRLHKPTLIGKGKDKTLL